MNNQVVTIMDRDSGSTARVLVSLGFNCFSWQPYLEDGAREMLWAGAGFEAGDKRPSSSGVPLLFPFPGRIAGAAFQFNGHDYRLEPGDAFGNAIHGFVYNRPWRLVTHDESRVSRRISGVSRRRNHTQALAGRLPHRRFVRSSRARAGKRYRIPKYGRWAITLWVGHPRLLSAAVNRRRRCGRHRCYGAGVQVLGA